MCLALAATCRCYPNPVFVQRHWEKGEESCGDGGGVGAGGGDEDESTSFLRASVPHLCSISILKRET